LRQPFDNSVVHVQALDEGKEVVDVPAVGVVALDQFLELVCESGAGQ